MNEKRVPIEPTREMLVAAVMTNVGPDPDGVHREEPWLKALWANMLAAAPEPSQCEWSEEDPNGHMPGTYNTACGEMWAFTDGGVKENNVRFCQGCGKPVKVLPYIDPHPEKE